MLEVYTLEDCKKWDDIVRANKKYDSYWLSGYVKAFKIHGDGEPLLFVYRNKNNVFGINVVMKRDIADDKRFQGKLNKGELFDFSTPYGYGGWLVNGSDCEQLFKEYDAWCKDNAIVSEFVRFHPMIKNHESVSDYYDVVQLGEVVHMDISSREKIWQNLTSKNRNVIRKAKKNGIAIYSGRYPQLFETFRNIYNETMVKDNADEYYYFQPDFYESILDDLAENAQIFFAEKDNKIIAASIILAANGMLNYHLSGSLKEYSSFAATNLLLYKTALWGCENGYKTMYLGGGVGSGEDSLFKFKRAFYRGDLNRFYIGKKIFMQEKYDGLIQRRQCISDSSFFPTYRA